LESALAQTSADVEIIVSDNGSVDDTPAVLARYDDPRLRKFRRDETISATDHHEFLVDSARGELFLGLSDDDWLEPDFAARVLEHFARHPEAKFVYTCCWTEMAGMKLTSQPGPEMEESSEFLEAYFSGQRQVFWCACVCRVADLKRLGPLPAGRVMGDMFFWTKLACEGPVGCVAEHLAHYTFLVDNTSLGTSVGAWSDDSALMIDEVRHLSRTLAPNARWSERFEAALRSYLARTTANQFALLAARGASKRSLLGAVGPMVKRLSGDWATALPRVAVACTLPAPVVRWLLLLLIRRRTRAAA
jgi:hypothetical protein